MDVMMPSPFTAYSAISPLALSSSMTLIRSQEHPERRSRTEERTWDMRGGEGQTGLFVTFLFQANFSLKEFGTKNRT